MLDVGYEEKAPDDKWIGGGVKDVAFLGPGITGCLPKKRIGVIDR